MFCLKTLRFTPVWYCFLQKKISPVKLDLLMIFHHLKNLSPSHVRSSQTERKRGGRVIRSTIWKRIEDLNSEILITNILQYSKCLRQNQIYQKIATQPKSVQRFHDCGMSFSIFNMKSRVWGGGMDVWKYVPELWFPKLALVEFCHPWKYSENRF